MTDVTLPQWNNAPSLALNQTINDLWNPLANTDTSGLYKMGVQNYKGVATDVAKADPGAFTQSSMFGPKGWVAPVMQGVGSLASIYMGAKNLGLAEDTFEMQSSLAKTNLANQAKLTNAELLGKERARLAGSGMSTAEINARMKEYADKYAVSGSTETRNA